MLNILAIFFEFWNGRTTGHEQNCQNGTVPLATWKPTAADIQRPHMPAVPITDYLKRYATILLPILHSKFLGLENLSTM